jgi:hypothetical protein
MESRKTICSLGVERWYNELGQLHREGNPAVVFAEIVKVWYYYGKRHRLDGPALVINSTTVYSSVSYYIEGKKYTKEDYPQAVLQYKLRQLLNE